MVREFKNYHKRLGKHVLFTPHIIIESQSHIESISQDCILNGKYCITVSDPSIVSQGSELVKEAIREICLYN